MGWFWADSAPRARSRTAVAPPRDKNHQNIDTASPPPGCPMHKTAASATTPFPPAQISLDPKTSSCPVMAPKQSARTLNTPQSQSSQPSGARSNVISKLNPLNYIPSLANKQEYSEQTISLPLDRETSTIPRGDADALWEYPSPQQMYNAMLRKGYTDTPADAVESMVAVHNFLNEGAWNEIKEWEDIFSKGLLRGWEQCRKGEAGMAAERARMETLRARRKQLNPKAGGMEDEEGPRLLRFMGRPSDRTPKASLLQYMGWVWPETYGTEPPFDRHDWYVARKTPTGSKEVRYVIDYYAGGAQETGEPVFYLDIRPALDTPTAAVERAMRWGGDVWHRASGASVREQATKN